MNPRVLAMVGAEWAVVLLLGIYSLLLFGSFHDPGAGERLRLSLFTKHSKGALVFMSIVMLMVALWKLNHEVIGLTLKMK